ncbi:MAG: hypothetical protein M1818_008389 [Claussenomyces sp. TS43310]|nr:MAG: hypothetical protein M1818_008389 [Claussenomyces sp. TS43310]
MDETQAFLPADVEKSNSSERECRRSRWFCGTKASLLVHFLLILTYTAISYGVIKLNSNELEDPPNAQAIEFLSVKHDPQPYEIYESSRFSGPPGPEVDEAWRQLLQPMAIRVSKQELIRNNRTSVNLPNGGYMA